ncbi:hypothetical protein B0H11DRAFT_1900594 [Mycena galericulata]|nr:hypothetical protein B0H11DRAFT_1900594 [Mycena galericulata]
MAQLVVSWWWTLQLLLSFYFASRALLPYSLPLAERLLGLGRCCVVASGGSRAQIYTRAWHALAGCAASSGALGHADLDPGSWVSRSTLLKYSQRRRVHLMHSEGLIRCVGGQWPSPGTIYYKAPDDKSLRKKEISGKRTNVTRHWHWHCKSFGKFPFASGGTCMRANTGCGELLLVLVSSIGLIKKLKKLEPELSWNESHHGEGGALSGLSPPLGASVRTRFDRRGRRRMSRQRSTPSHIARTSVHCTRRAPCVPHALRAATACQRAGGSIIIDFSMALYTAGRVLPGEERGSSKIIRLAGPDRLGTKDVVLLYRGYYYTYIIFMSSDNLQIVVC